MKAHKQIEDQFYGPLWDQFWYQLGGRLSDQLRGEV